MKRIERNTKVRIDEHGDPIDPVIPKVELPEPNLPSLEFVQKKEIDEVDINKELAKLYPIDNVYTCSGQYKRFGDQLAWCNLISRLSIGHGKPVKVTNVSFLFKKVFNEILNTRKAKYIEIPDYPDAQRIGGWSRNVYRWKFLPARITYKPEKVSDIICYQLDSRSKKDKQLQSGEKEKLIKAIESKGFKAIELGKMNSEKMNMTYASQCKLFVGICSGMSHLCHAVGCPVHVIINERSARRTKKYHRAHPTTFHHRAEDFIKFLESYK